jgi:2-dehydropantoate 2-reductase
MAEAVGGGTPRLKSLLEVFEQAGFDATGSENIQRDIWYKLWGNMTHNPIWALTGATCGRIGCPVNRVQKNITP